MGEDTYKCGGAPLHAGLRRPKLSVTFVSQCCACVVGALSSNPLSCFFSPRSPSTWPQPSDLFCVTNKTPSRCLGLSRLVLRAPPLSTPGAASWGPTWSPEFIVPFSFTTIRFKKKKKLGQIILFNRLLFNSHIISCLIIVHELLIRITVFDIILC